MAEVLLGFGGNLGDPVETIGVALQRVAEQGVRIRALSHLYRTAPWGVRDQPDFINLCAAACTTLAPRALLAVTRATEAELGRERRERWGPRLIDIDILAYDEMILHEPGLTLPHPRLTERAFVLVPLLDIAPDSVIQGKSVRDWAAQVDGSGVERIERTAEQCGESVPRLRTT